jgi:hypothetical protein
MASKEKMCISFFFFCSLGWAARFDLRLRLLPGTGIPLLIVILPVFVATHHHHHVPKPSSLSFRLLLSPQTLVPSANVLNRILVQIGSFPIFHLNFAIPGERF